MPALNGDSSTGNRTHREACQCSWYSRPVRTAGPADHTGGVMRQTRRIAAALSAGMLLLTACGNDADDNPEPIGGDEDAQEDSEPEPDEGDDEDDEEPYAVPDEIDEDYAEDVINALLEIDFEALRIALEQESGENLDFDAADRVHAISDGRRRERFLETLQDYVDDPEPPEALLPSSEMSATRFDAEMVIHAEPERCMIVAGWWDLSNTTVDPPGEEEKSLFSLARVDREVTEADRNPTPWAIRHVSQLTDPDGEPIPAAEWQTLDFGDALDHECEDR